VLRGGSRIEAIETIEPPQKSGQQTGQVLLSSAANTLIRNISENTEMAEELAKKPAKKRTAKALGLGPDRDESVSAMEPMLISESSRHRGRLNELVFELTRAATALRTGLPDGMVEALCNLVRSMNCYYSNLIEGHNTHPIDIERALAEDYSTNKEQCDLQLEAKAHMTTQRWIDEGGLKGAATTMNGVLEAHRRFESACRPIFCGSRIQTMSDANR
jgi:hypothetical protein